MPKRRYEYFLLHAVEGRVVHTQAVTSHTLLQKPIIEPYPKKGDVFYQTGKNFIMATRRSPLVISPVHMRSGTQKKTIRRHQSMPLTASSHRADWWDYLCNRKSPKILR